MMNKFVPLSGFEVALVEAKDGRIPMQDLLSRLVDEELVVASATEVMADGTGLQPLIFKKEDVWMLACFSDKTRIGDMSTKAPYCLSMKGRDILARIPPGSGLVLNPGWPVGFDISPEGIEKIVRDFIAVRPVN